MKRMAVIACAGILASGIAHAGGIDRSRLSYGVMFEEGNYAEFGLSRVSPEVSGTYGPATGPFNGTSTGNMAGDYSTLSFAYKHQFGEKLHFGLFVNQPYGADASYTQGPYTGLDAEWESRQIAGILRYEVTPAVSVYGGLRYVKSDANIQLPPALVTFNYTASGSTSDVGYLVGAAYEKPEIALRVALTYESAITHRFPTTETWVPLGGSIRSTTEIELPQSIALDFQSGIARDTLLFGSVRWSEWSKWSVRPPGYFGIVGDEITGFDNDVTTWQLGIGRRLNENFSVFARLGYEKANGGIASRLSPTDGMRSLGIGGTFTRDNVKVTAGLEYVELGDAVDGSGTRFRGNSALGFGINVGVRF